MKKVFAILFLTLLLPCTGTADVLVGDVDGDEQLTMADVAQLIDCIKAPSHYYGGVEYVDMGMSDGVLWAKTNVGATTPEGYGNHYAWGEVTPKDSFVWATYKWGVSSTKLTRYCNSASYGTKDGLSTLCAEDDAAHVVNGSTWHIPTIDEWQELKNNAIIWADSVNHVKGYKVMSRKTYKTLFFPFSGYRSSEYIYNEGYNAFYWANSTFSVNCAEAYGFNVDDSYQGWGYRDRYLGNPIRPVIYPYEKVCDINADGSVNLTDVIYLANLVMNAR